MKLSYSSFDHGFHWLFNKEPQIWEDEVMDQLLDREDDPIQNNYIAGSLDTNR